MQANTTVRVIKKLTLLITLLAALAGTQAQAGYCKVDLIRLKEVEVRKPAKALDDVGTQVLSEAITTVITAGAGKVVDAGLKSAVTSYRLASKAGSRGFVVGQKVIGKAAEKAINFGVSELISYVDDTVRTPDDLLIRVGGRLVYSTPKEMPFGILDVLSPNYEGSFYGSFSIQLIEYDSASANDDLGTIYGRDQNLLVGQLPPLNQESLEIVASSEDDSHYRVDYEIIPGAGNLNDIPERLFCNTDECQDARENYPSDFYFAYPGPAEMKACPDGYTDAGGTYLGNATYSSTFGPWYRVCELHTGNCGEPFKTLADNGGIASLQTGDVIVLRGRTTHQAAQTVNPDFCDNLTDTCEPRTYHKYLSNSNGNGQYLGVCTDCTGDGNDNAGLYYMDRDRTVTQWTVTKLPSGKFTLQGSNGKYLARCQGCSGMSQAAYVHVTDPSAAYAQFTIAQSPTPSGDFIYTLQADTGAYLSSCLGCGDLNNYKLGYGYAGSFHIVDANNDSAKWSIGVKQADWDEDGDGVVNMLDAFPTDKNEWKDTDGDGIGDNSDLYPNNPDESADSDGDGIANNADPCPNDPEGIVDSDGDGFCDNVDLFPNDINSHADTDGDGVSDYFDRFPLDPAESVDSDWDGVGNNSDLFPYDSNNLRHIEVDNSNGWVINYAAFGDPSNSPTPAEVVMQDWPVYFKLTGGISGSTARVTFTYENPIDPEAVLFKIMCGDLSCVDSGIGPEDSYYITNQSLLIEGNKITVIYTDGGVVDEDGIANEVIESAMLWAGWVPALIADGIPLVGRDLTRPEPTTSGSTEESTGGAVNFWILVLLLSGLSASRLTITRRHRLS